MNETMETTETTTDYSVPTSDVSMDTNDNHADYSYGDYKQDDFSVPTEPGNPLDKKVDERVNINVGTYYFAGVKVSF